MSGAPVRSNVHGTALVVAGEGILIRGPARSGKSALALSTLRRAEALGVPARLVADDQVFLERRPEGVVATAPEAIRGLIEISGVGILSERSVPAARLTLVVDLLEPEAIQRMPGERTVALCGGRLRRIVLPVRQAAFGADVLNSLARQASAPEADAAAGPDLGPGHRRGPGPGPEDSEKG